jgi:hypothetical protein
LPFSGDNVFCHINIKIKLSCKLFIHLLQLRFLKAGLFATDSRVSSAALFTCVGISRGAHLSMLAKAAVCNDILH